MEKILGYIDQLRAEVGNTPLIMAGCRVILTQYNDKEILLQRRTDFGIWGLLGGALEIGESIDQCVRREVFEETKLEIDDMNIFGVCSDPNFETVTYPNGDVVQLFAIECVVRSWKGNPTADLEEGSALSFFSIDCLPTLLEHEARSVDNFKKYLKTGSLQVH